MPKIVKKLSVKEIAAITAPGMHAVSEGLYLRVQASGAKSWIYRYSVKVGDKTLRREMGLGTLKKLSVSEAREEVARYAALVREGEDPITHRNKELAARAQDRASRATFAEVAAQCIAAMRPEWKNPKHAQQWSNTLEAYVLPFIGYRPVNEITREDVLRLLEAPTELPGDPPVKGTLWGVKTETASRVRGRIERVMAYAKARGMFEGENPAAWRGGLDSLLAKPTKVKTVRHQPALPYAKMPEFMAALRAEEGTAARILEFAILTAARSGEARGARWSEIDLDKAEWCVPAHRMKAGREHVVALSPAAVELLRNTPRVDDSDLVFPAQRGGELSDMALSQLMRRMNGLGRPDVKAEWLDKDGAEAVPHGFRSTFRDWAGEVSAYPREVIEHAMAHQLKDKAEAAYARGTLFEKRRALMADWAAWCGERKPGKVVPLRKAAA